MPRAPDPAMTARVGELVAAGSTYATVARLLGIGVTTVKRHIKYAKRAPFQPAGRTMVSSKCAQCGAEFRTQPSRIKNGKGRFCSISCSRLARAAPRVECSCRECGTKFLMLDSRIRSGHGIYCSIACSTAARAKARLPGARKRIRYVVETHAEAEIAETARAKQVPAQRRCLGGCGQMFASAGAGNRICPRCTDSDARAGYAVMHETRGLHVR